MTRRIGGLLVISLRLVTRRVGSITVMAAIPIMSLMIVRIRASIRSISRISWLIIVIIVRSSLPAVTAHMVRPVGGSLIAVGVVGWLAVVRSVMM